MRREPSVGRLRVCLMVALAMWSTTAAAQEKKPVDLTGKWTFTVQTDAGTGTPSVAITQKGDSVSGHYSSQTLGEHDFKGTIKDGKITFSFTSDVQGTSLRVAYTGTVENAESMKGTLDLGGMASGTFTAKKEKS